MLTCQLAPGPFPEPLDLEQNVLYFNADGPEIPCRPTKSSEKVEEGELKKDSI